MKYRVRVEQIIGPAPDDDHEEESFELYCQAVEFNPIPEISEVLNKPRRKVRKDAGVKKGPIFWSPST